MVLDGDKSVTATFAISGSTLWTKQVGSAGDDFSASVGIAPDGDVIIAGVLSGAIDVDGIQIAAAGPPGFPDILVMKA